MAVGDAEFQQKAQRRIRDLTSQGITTLIISHNPAEVELIARRCIYIRSGAMEFDGQLAKAMELYSSHMHQEIGEHANGAPELHQVRAPNPSAGEDGSRPNSESPEFRLTETEGPPGPQTPAQGPLAEIPAHEILGLKAQNPDGQGEIVSGENLQVYLHYRTSFVGLPIPIQVSIWTEHDVMVTVADTRHQDVVGPTRNEVGVAVCTFRALPLTPGTYVVRALMFHPHEEGLALASFGLEGDERVCAFAVRPPAAMDEWTADTGILALPFEWSRPSASPAPLQTTAPAAISAPQAVSISVQSGQAVQISLHLGAHEKIPLTISLNAAEAPTVGASSLPPLSQPNADGSRLPSPASVRQEWVAKPPNSIVSFLHYAMRISDGLLSYILYKEIFFHQIYHFHCTHPDPLILDVGSDLGMSILYFKHLYPHARVIGFEPDPSFFHLLQENVARNGLEDVTLISTPLGVAADTRGALSSSLESARSVARENQVFGHIRPLSEFIHEPIDLLKLTLGSGGLVVLQELAATDKLKQIKELVVGFINRPQEAQYLGPLLDLLAGEGFRYLVHDFDAETNEATKPPFRIDATTEWPCLVYARRLEESPPATVGRNENGAAARQESVPQTDVPAQSALTEVSAAGQASRQT
jgi:FkbM family methyltransferase